jgi:hypothetical protein
MNGMERDDINPDFLRKYELEYEIFVHKGQPPQLRKVVDLQKTLRDIMREPVDLQYLQSLDFEGELRTIHAKVNEFKEIVGVCRSDCYISPSQYARVTTRLRHLNCRFADLVSSSRVKGDKLSLLDQIADLMQTAAELHSSTNVVPNDPELPPISHARNPPVTASVDTAPSDAPGPSSLSHHFQQPSGPCETGLHPTVSSQFQCARLPNPIERILSQKPVLSGDTLGSENAG